MDPTLVPLLKQVIEKHRYLEDPASFCFTVNALANLGWYDEPEYILSVATDERLAEHTRERL